MSDESDLAVLLESHFPLITINTHEETRAVDLIKRVITRTDRSLYLWSVTEGITTQQQNFSADSISLQGHNDHTWTNTAATKEPDAALTEIKRTVKNGVLVLLDFHSYLSEPTTLRLLKEIAQEHQITRNTVVLLSHDLDLPAEISRLNTRFELSLPSAEQIEQIILDEAKLWALKNQNQRVRTDKKSIDLLVRNLQGLTTSDTKRLVRNAIYNDGALTQSDLAPIMKAKYQLLGQEGVLSFEYETSQFSEVGGFDRLVRWVQQRRAAFLQHSAAPIDIPKGVLLLGVQGCGKSLAARAVAGVWGVPLLRMDFGALYNKFFGETEKNIRAALKTAELMSPCVLWMDEVEKGVATGDNDGGTSRRVLATLLTWMADNKKPVFIVATANNIQSLPPELIRKGRMDEIFFVDLPDHESRAEIFTIHIRKRNHDPAAFNIAELAKQSNGFSGAEIEQAVVSAVYSAHGEEKPMETRHILQEITATQPLSIVMDEQITALRLWAQGRTVNVK